ncbi:transcriptional regulator [Bordetella genomosp. 1]|uniref:Transcriptional regulator n=1 Tax=Bordetella genomosp. 1 TaxID=1395607 RepID=A0A261SFR6_9BORD|nr:FMN-binding negative transcriptional regulator [Bordetella genomosp. 1]OZI36259.1 transcriptional regulator [Bordetella genomosp. 1]
MYLPAHFAEQRSDELLRIITGHPLGMLVTHDADGLDANHLPFEFDPAAAGHGVLRAHVARANTVWQTQRDGNAVMVVFSAQEGYISPNWYPSKHEHHRQVPTWNYQVVHVHGRLRIVDDERFVRGLVARLTRTHEADQPRPWKMTDAPADFIDQMLQAIVGIEIEIDRIEGKSKLGQHKDARDRAGTVTGLRERGKAELAQATEDARKD